MSDHDRGAYTPPSERLSFDPREPVRSGGPAPVTLIISGVVLLAIVGGVFLLYRGGVRQRGDVPTAVGTPIAQMKTVAPPDANDAGLVISRVDASNAANATFAPPPEQPLPRPLPFQAPSVVTATPLPPAGSAASPSAPRPVATTTAKPAKPMTIASLADDAMAQKPAAPKPPPAPPTITPPAPVATADAAPGTSWVQIGAFSSAALADKGWSDVAAFAPAGMAGKGRKVAPVAKDGKTFYRAYVTGFAGRDAAQAFCDRLKASGKACFVK